MALVKVAMEVNLRPRTSTLCGTTTCFTLKYKIRHKLSCVYCPIHVVFSTRDNPPKFTSVYF